MAERKGENRRRRDGIINVGAAWGAIIGGSGGGGGVEFPEAPSSRHQIPASTVSAISNSAHTVPVSDSSAGFLGRRETTSQYLISLIHARQSRGLVAATAAAIAVAIAAAIAAVAENPLLRLGSWGIKGWIDRRIVSSRPVRSRRCLLVSASAESAPTRGCSTAGFRSVCPRRRGLPGPKDSVCSHRARAGGSAGRHPLLLWRPLLPPL